MDVLIEIYLAMFGAWIMAVVAAWQVCRVKRMEDEIGVE